MKEKCNIRRCAAVASQGRKRDKEGIYSHWNMMTNTMQYDGDPLAEGKMTIQ